ncbi:MAG: Zn-dependent hydrolase [Chloroflexi bacterium]|nr:MAG: Zn-dependent hydrolase [Chloroflexota bacterium]
MPSLRSGARSAVSDINGERLLADLRTLAAIGGLPDGGVDRLAWSEHDLAGRRWFAERIAEAGIETRVDAALNVFGHLPGTVGPWVLESGDPFAERLEIVGFADEEGVRFESGLIGSLALVGELDIERLRDGLDWQGVPIRQVLAGAGRDLDRMLEAQQHRDSIKAFLELHIEQGPRMEANGIELAVVTGIVGVHRQRIEIQGTQNHAGTTPFRLRHDAGRAAARAASELRDLIQGVDAEAVANIGSMGFHPGGVNVIPGRAQFTLEVRHPDERVIGKAVSAFATRLQRICEEEGCRVVVELLSSVPPAPMNETVVVALEQVCTELGRRPARLSSGAGHDAAVLSRHVPTGMLFVPSVGGLSHSPRETTSDEHLVLGARALLRGVRAVTARIK